MDEAHDLRLSGHKLRVINLCAFYRICPPSSIAGSKMMPPPR